MTSSNKERYYSTVGKSRRSSPGDPHSGHGFFSGQGLFSQCTVVDQPAQSHSFEPTVPVSYSNVYTQPRSAPNKLAYDPDPQALYGAYPNSNTSPQFPSGFPNYEIHHERYSPHPSYPTYPSRSTPPILTNPADSRRLPPLPTSSPPPGERWSQQAFVPQSGFPATNIRSPTATYPTHNQFMQYPSANQAHAYHYHFAQDHLSLNPAHNGIFDEISRLDPRSTSPFRNPGSSHVPPPQPPHSYSPPPISPTSPEEPTVKKKRKRADANQLKVLNETYARTAFPSTEERIALAKMLDMSARSVQIWFQNKRQSMRQTNRQTASSSSTSQLPPSTSQMDSTAEELAPHHAYDTRSLHDPLYLTSPQADASRAHASHHSAYGNYHPSSYRHRD